MSDIVERLEKFVASSAGPEASMQMLRDAITEIQRLRGLIGAVNTGTSFHDMKLTLGTTLLGEVVHHDKLEPDKT